MLMMKVLNFHLQQKNHELESLRLQLQTTSDRMSNENYQKGVKLDQSETDLRLIKEEAALLRSEKTSLLYQVTQHPEQCNGGKKIIMVAIMQVRQMQEALKSSLEHIQGLRSQLEKDKPPMPPPYDEDSLTSLLNLASTPRPALSSLQTCLSDLRQEVADLNSQLSDRCSRESTPSLLAGFDRSKCSSITPCSSTTPSLAVSTTCSLNSSPEHAAANRS